MTTQDGRGASTTNDRVTVLLLIAFILQLLLLATTTGSALATSASLPVPLLILGQFVIVLACLAIVVLHRIWQPGDASSDASPCETKAAPATRQDAAPDRILAAAPAALSAGAIGDADLIARICHELRTPLNAVIGFSGLMREEIFGPVGHPRYQEYLSHIEASSRDLLRSTEDTLALAALVCSREDVQFEHMALEPVIQEAIAIVAAANAPAAARIDVRVSDTDYIVADRRGLRQALANLLLDACDHATAHSTITLSATPSGSQLSVSLTWSEAAARSSKAPSSLAQCLARALLDLQGTPVTVTTDNRGGWRADIILDRAAMVTQPGSASLEPQALAA